MPVEGRFDQIGTGIASLVGALAAFCVPTLVAFAIAFGRALPRAWQAENEWTRLIGRMFVARSFSCF